MKHCFLAAISACLFASQPVLAGQITLMNEDDYVWETTPEGVAFAPLQGDRFAEPYQALVRLPGGTVSPPHVKSANMFGVVLQGEMLHYASGEDPTSVSKIGPGSFYRIPHDLAHISACISQDPCITYLYQDGAFDFTPVDP